MQTPHPNHQKPSKNPQGAKPDRFDAGSVESENDIYREGFPRRRDEESSKHDESSKQGLRVELPFLSEAFSEAWQTWVQHRRESRQKLTPTATRLQLSKLQAMGEARAIAAIEHSISGNYQGIFEPKSAATTEKPRFSPIGHPLNEAARRQAASKPKFSLT